MVAALATIVGTNTILLTPTFAAVDDTTTFNFGEVEYNNSSPKTVTSLYQQQRGNITEGSDVFKISCGWAVAYYCAVSVKDNLDASETPYTGIATINNKTYALTAKIIPAKINVTIYGQIDNFTVYNGEEHSYTGFNAITPSGYSKESIAVKDATKNTLPDNSGLTTFEITKRAVTVNITGNSKEVTYNSKTQELQGLKIDFTDSIYNASKISVNGLALETLKAKEVGVYENTLEEEWFTNIDEEHFDVTFNVVSGTLTIKEAPVVNPITPSVKTASVLSPETGFNTTIANTAGSNTNISENILATAVIILASVATLGLYSLIHRHNN